MENYHQSSDHPGVEFIGPATVFPNVTIGEGSVVYGPCVLGQPPRGKAPGELPLVIGANSVIRTFSVIYAGVKMGDRCQTGHSTVIREGNVLGDDCSVGTLVGLEPYNQIGNRVRIHTDAGMERATLEDDVFIGPGARLLDDPHPPCPRSPECVGGPIIKRAAVIGADALVVPGVTVGERAVVASGAVAASDVPPEVLVAGVPARVIKRVDELECWPGFYERPYIWSEPDSDAAGRDDGG